jgi:formimidoylglutamate deiminase
MSHAVDATIGRMTEPSSSGSGARQAQHGAAPHQVVHADWVWTGGRLERTRAVGIDRGGRIVSVAAPSGPSTLRLPGRALIPGFVSAHSHAFQRDLRGGTERFGRGHAGNDGGTGFFTWRDAMYALVASLDPDRCYEASRRAFAEMLAAGITSVGEFHYVRHADPVEGPEDEGLRWAFDASVLAAARDAGIRIVLLHACYMRGGFAAPLAGGQVRFRVRDEADYWRRADALGGLLHGPTQTLGATAHSVRAVPIEAIEGLHRESVRRGLVFHIHVEEVRKEIEECRAMHDRTPSRLLIERLAIDERTTAVHCTHTTPEDLAAWARSGATICLCPLTEGNLGDGICDVPAFRAAGGRLAFGTDLNSRLAPTEELRWIEYVQRIRRERRGLVVDAEGDSGAALLEIGTANGARSLGIDAGAIEPGKLADFAVVDLGHPTMLGWTPETFASHLVFGTGTSAVCGTCVGGAWRMRR